MVASPYTLGILGESPITSHQTAAWEEILGWILRKGGIKFKLRSGYLFCADRLWPWRSLFSSNKLQGWKYKKCPILQGYFYLDPTLQKTTYRCKSRGAIQSLKSYRLIQTASDGSEFFSWRTSLLLTWDLDFTFQELNEHHFLKDIRPRLGYPKYGFRI